MGRPVRKKFQDYVREILDKKSATFFSKLFLLILSLIPLSRAFILAKKGEVSRPLTLLKFGTFGVRDASILKDRLADMDSYLHHPINREFINSSSRLKSFNGNVLLAFHSLGAFDPSGYAVRSIALLRAINNRGVATFPIIRPGYPWDLAQHRNAKKLEKIEYQNNIFQMFPESKVSLRSPESQYIDSYADLISKKIEETNSSIVHAASNYLNGIAAARAGFRTGVKSVYELRGLWHLTRAFSDPGYAKTEHYQYVEKRELEACKCVDQVITLSESMAEWLELRGIHRDKITVVGNAAFPPKACTGGQDTIPVRRKLDIPQESFVLGYIGSIVEYEGLDVLIQTHARLPKLDRPFLLFVGSGKTESYLKALVSQEGTSDEVMFAGRIDPADVSMYYHAMDAVALPRKDDMLTRLVPAIKPFEVIAHGKPLLISRALGLALRGTMSEDAYTVVDFSSSQSLQEALAAIQLHPVSTCPPTWDDRAQEIIDVYKSGSSSVEVLE